MEINSEFLKRFCAADSTRYSIQKPWSRGMFSYATNGHIAVRIARQSEIEENPKAPNVGKLFSDAYGVKNYVWMPVPDSVTVRVEKCDDCEAGFWEGPDDEKIHCDYCNGTGKQEIQERIPFEAGGKTVFLNSLYLVKLIDIPGIMLGITPDASAPWQSHGGEHKPRPIRFVFTGGDGLLMAMRG